MNTPNPYSKLEIEFAYVTTPVRRLEVQTYLDILKSMDENSRNIILHDIAVLHDVCQHFSCIGALELLFKLGLYMNKESMTPAQKEEIQKLIKCLGVPETYKHKDKYGRSLL